MTESGHAFGLEAEGTVDPLDELFADDPVEETPAAPEPAAEAPAPEPEAPAAETAPEPEAVVPDPDTPADAEQPAAPEKLWAGRFDSPEKLEESYKEAQRWGTRESQRRAELEREYQTLKSQWDQYQPYLQRLAAEQQANGLVNEMGETDPAKVQSLVQQEAQRLFAAQQQAAEQAAAKAEIEAFRSAHPEVPGSAVEADIVRLFAEYQREADGDFRPTRDNLEAVHTLAVDPRIKAQLDRLQLFPDPEYVAVAKELVEHPELARVVEAHPHVVDSDAGMAWARTQAQMPQAVAAAQTSASEQQAQRAQEQKNKAYVEKGGTGAPAAAAPGDRPSTWLEEIMAVEQRDSPNSNVLGL